MVDPRGGACRLDTEDDLYVPTTTLHPLYNLTTLTYEVVAVASLSEVLATLGT